MPQIDYLKERFPLLGGKLPRMHIAMLPTPVSEVQIDTDNGTRRLSIKHDNLTGKLYGGNKLRKLEYIFPRALEKKCARIATFGATGSNHALATALYARQAGFECTCFLSHQARTALVPATLNRHIENHTDIVRFGGTYQSRIRTLRENLWNKNAWVIPMGGSSWLGTMGFVTAGLELAAQIEDGEIPRPDRLYVGTGTMGTAAGIALGLAIAKIDTEIHAVRVSDELITNERAMNGLLGKTAAMMHRLDPSIGIDIAAQTNIVIRDEFFGPGYAQSTPATDVAIVFAKSQLNLTLESTYTGKTIAALQSDLHEAKSDGLNILYWHTFNSVPLHTPTDRPLDARALPEEFMRYFDQPSKA